MSFAGISLTTLAAMSFARFSHTTWRQCLSQDRVTKFDTLFLTFTIIANIAYLHFFSPFIFFVNHLVYSVMFKKNQKGKGKATTPPASVSDTTSLETEKLQKQAAGQTKSLFGRMVSSK